ncbi:hypothetical protein GKE82_25965 [Conexibacter sp. W3-3-2]|uniref:sensor histidine kinase n=1 Tax=Conexibacter sp. W3-3-2 TaxID=2675227 RepID=UPI0012B8F569|nr:ATP-binding protein [Conexibacter sp. W3-3-2]MTD47652.1 hypothetical protein [Conexibacter sp. W3-3-2]
MLRVSLMPVIAIGELLVDRDLLSPGFWWVYAAAAIYAVAVLVVVMAGREPVRLGHFTAVADLSFLMLLEALSGGAFSQIRRALYIVPLWAAMTQAPRATAWWALGAVLVYLTAALVPVDRQLPADATEQTIVHGLYLAWTGAMAVLFARILQARRRQVAEHEARRQRLIADAVGAQQRERRRLAYALHDGPVQNLLSADLRLRQAKRGDLSGFDDARSSIKRTVAELRDALFELHPHQLDLFGLAPALRDLAARVRATTDAEIDIEVTATSKLYDDLLFQIARELLTNAARHAHATRISATVQQTEDRLTLTVSDDGHGIPPGRLTQAREQGHLGLAAMAERLHAFAGTLEIDTGTDGTTVRIALPIRRTADHAHAESVAPSSAAVLERRRSAPMS